MTQHSPTLRIVISASNALAKWLKHDLVEELPRMPGLDEKLVGRQPLVTDTTQISWQCHVSHNYYRSRECMVIATEAHSRHTLLLPYERSPKRVQLENDLLRRWAMDLAYLAVKHEQLKEEDLPALIDAFSRRGKAFTWYRNTDLSVNGHVTDAEMWVRQMLEDTGLRQLSETHVLDLCDHINHLPKRAKKGQANSDFFMPALRFLEDGLGRFAVPPVSDDSRITDFPDLRSDRTPSSTKSDRSQGKNKSNVICLETFRKRKSLD